jgi:hypothetical protein
MTGIRHQKKLLAAAKWRGEPVAAGRRFCDKDCRDDYERYSPEDGDRSV